MDIIVNKFIALIPKIGIKNPAINLENNLYHFNNLIKDLRNLKIIDKRIFIIKYKDNYGGQFIIGMI